MNINKLFSRLKEKGVDEAEARWSSRTSFSCYVFHKELCGYESSGSSTLNVDAIIDNKLAMVNTEDLSNKNIDNIIDDLFLNAKYTNKTGAEIYKEKAKYKKFNGRNKELLSVDAKDKIKIIFEIEDRLKNIDPSVYDVEVGYSECDVTSSYQSTFGIKLKEKFNFYSISASLIMNDGESKKTTYQSFTDNDLSKFNIDNFINDLYIKAKSKLNGKDIKSDKYDVVLSPEVVASLLTCYISQLNAEEVLKGSSWFKDKLDKKVASKKVTIIQNPFERNLHFNSFDDQGVPCQKRVIVKNGVLQGYFHNLETAKKFNIPPTGEASASGSKISISPHHSYLKPGRLTKEELIQKVKNGVYITSLEGLHAGMNAKSGDFSLKAEGYVIEDGKIGPYINMITISSNLFTIFQNIRAVSENILYAPTSGKMPCVYLKKIAISC